MKIVEKEKVDVVEEQKAPELCAIPKEFVLKNLNDLYTENKVIFDQYNLWIQALNSLVQVTKQEETI